MYKRQVPYGTAHFLEHQMFEQPEGNIMERFAELGAEANAFTDSGKTVYYFKTAENFIENFRVLLDFVETPYFEKTKMCIRDRSYCFLLNIPYIQLYIGVKECQCQHLVFYIGIK